jgi:hypothetical protein
MIDAGVAVLLEHYPETALGDAQDRTLVRKIFLKMSAQAGGRADPASGA